MHKLHTMQRIFIERKNTPKYTPKPTNQFRIQSNGLQCARWQSHLSQQLLFQQPLNKCRKKMSRSFAYFGIFWFALKMHIFPTKKRHSAHWLIIHFLIIFISNGHKTKKKALSCWDFFVQWNICKANGCSSVNLMHCWFVRKAEQNPIGWLFVCS